MTSKNAKKKTDFSRAKKTRSDISMGKRLAATAGLRFDEGKIRFDLIPPEWHWALADVMTEGVKKYAERNWEKGMSWSKMIGCAGRHILKFMCGERYDDETGCHHLAMAAWNLLSLMSYDLRGVGEPDFSNVDMSLLARINSGKGTNNADKSARTRKPRRRSTG